MLLANIFMFFFSNFPAGDCLALIPPRLAPAIARWVRFFCLLFLLGALLYFPQISSVDQLISKASPITLYYPPIWFIGIYEILLGSHDAMIWGLAGRGLLALVLAGGLCILTYAICYRRFMHKSVESESGVSPGSAGIRQAGNFILDRWFLRRPENRASYHFVAKRYSAVPGLSCILPRTLPSEWQSPGWD